MPLLPFSPRLPNPFYLSFPFSLPPVCGLLGAPTGGLQLQVLEAVAYAKRGTDFWEGTVVGKGGKPCVTEVSGSGCQRALGRFLKVSFPRALPKEESRLGKWETGGHEGASASPGSPTHAFCRGKKKNKICFYSMSPCSIAHPLVTHAHPRAN